MQQQGKSMPPWILSKHNRSTYKHWTKARSGLNYIFHHTFTRQARWSKQSSDLLYGLLFKLCEIAALQKRKWGLFKDFLCTFEISLFFIPLIDWSERCQRHGSFLQKHRLRFIKAEKLLQRDTIYCLKKQWRRHETNSTNAKFSTCSDFQCNSTCHWGGGREIRIFWLVRF